MSGIKSKKSTDSATTNTLIAVSSKGYSNATINTTESTNQEGSNSTEWLPKFIYMTTKSTSSDVDLKSENSKSSDKLANNIEKPEGADYSDATKPSEPPDMIKQDIIALAENAKYYAYSTIDTTADSTPTDDETTTTEESDQEQSNNSEGSSEEDVDYSSEEQQTQQSFDDTPGAVAETFSVSDIDSSPNNSTNIPLPETCDVEEFSEEWEIMIGEITNEEINAQQNDNWSYEQTNEKLATLYNDDICAYYNDLGLNDNN